MPTDSQTVFKVFLFTDIVGSTELKRRLGDAGAAGVVAAHDALFRDCLKQHHGEERDHAGDGFFATFDRPSDAVRCGLAFQKGLASLDSKALGMSDPLKSRVGIHIGEIVRLEGGGTGHDQDKLVGLAVDTTARVMGLAEGGQILITRGAFDTARQQVQTAPDGSTVTWLAHGPYIFKGIEEPVGIFEAGIVGLSPLKAPTGSEKAKRNVAIGDEATLGWRPGPGLEIPHRPNWLLEQNLGEGGFGEVWLATHKKTRERRVFKFCFQADRLRGLKREVVLFRLLKESLGDRDDIAKIIDWQFDVAPFFLEAEYTEGGSLSEWAATQGGIVKVPLATRISIVAQTAEALAAAHSVGVLHKDIKPANLLITKGRDNQPRVRLTDFGIGLITDRELLARQGISAAGFSASIVASKDSSASGTQMYMAPELLEGKPPTTQSDVYALGVVLYQVLCGDLTRALAPGWERDLPPVSDSEFLREDIAACVDGKPARRLPSASELAKRLRSLDARREAKEAERAAQEAAARAERLALNARRRKKQVTMAAIVGIVLIAGILIFAVNESRRAEMQSALRKKAEEAQTIAEQERRLAEEREQTVRRYLYVAHVNAAGEAMERKNVERVHELLKMSAPAAGTTDLRDFEWYYLWKESHKEPFTELLTLRSGENNKASIASAFAPDGSVFATSNADPMKASAPGEIIFWDSESGEKTFSLSGHAGGIGAIAFSPDGKTLASGGLDKTIKIWNLADHKLKNTFEGYGQWIFSLAFFPDGKRLVGVTASPLNPGRAGEVKIWNLETAKPEDTSFVHDIKGPVYAVAVSPDGAAMAVCTAYLVTGTTAGNNPGEAQIYNLKTGQRVALATNGNPFLSAVFSPDGKTLAFGTADGVVKIWNTENWSERFSFHAHTNFVFALAISPDGRFLLTGSGNPLNPSLQGEVKLWDVETGQEQTTLKGMSQRVKSIAFSPKGDRVALGTLDGVAKLWSRPKVTGENAFKTNGKWVSSLATAGENGDLLLGTGDLSSFKNPEAAARAMESSKGQKEENPSKSQVLTQNAATSEKKILADALTDEVSCVAVAPKGGYLAAGWLDPVHVEESGEAAIWNPKDGKEIARIKPPKGGVTCLDFSRDGKLLAVGTSDYTVILWDVEAGREKMTCRGASEMISAALLSPDAKTLLGFTNPRFGSSHTNVGRSIFIPLVKQPGKIKRWEVSSGKESGEVESHVGGVYCALYSPDGTYVVTGGGDGLIKTWDPATLKEKSSLVGHTRPVAALAFAPDGETLVSGTMAQSPESGELRFWDLTSGQSKLTLRTEGTGVAALAFAPNGKTLFAGTTDGSVKLWRAAADAEVAMPAK